jgi:hypothetical protein
LSDPRITGKCLVVCVLGVNKGIVDLVVVVKREDRGVYKFFPTNIRGGISIKRFGTTPDVGEIRYLSSIEGGIFVKITPSGPGEEVVFSEARNNFLRNSLVPFAV